MSATILSVGVSVVVAPVRTFMIPLLVSYRKWPSLALSLFAHSQDILVKGLRNHTFTVRVQSSPGVE